MYPTKKWELVFHLNFFCPNFKISLILLPSRERKITQDALFKIKNVGAQYPSDKKGNKKKVDDFFLFLESIHPISKIVKLSSPDLLPVKYLHFLDVWRIPDMFQIRQYKCKNSKYFICYQHVQKSEGPL
jgi:hypothetical protein